MSEVATRPKMAQAGEAVLVENNQPLTNQMVETPEPAGGENVEKKTDVVVGDAGESNQNGANPPLQSTTNASETNSASGNQDNSQKTVLSDEELKAEYEKRFPPKTEPTAEEIAKKDAAFEKRMLDLFIADGHKGDEFYLIKQVAEADLTEISKADLQKELIAKGLSGDLIQEILVEQYYQINPDEAEKALDETDEEFEERKELIKKKVAFGTEALTQRGAKIKADAQGIIDSLKNKIQQQDSEAAREVEFTAKVDTFFKDVPRKVSLQLGKLNDQDLGSIEVDVNEADLEEIRDSIKDPVRRQQLLFTDDGEINVEVVSNLLIKNKILETAAREALFEGQTRQVATFRKVFPANDPRALGIGANPSSRGNGQKGKLASFGEPEVINEPQTIRR